MPAGRVEGLSENIRVRSILGRYLEHSRIYRFAHGDVDDEPLYLIGSADVMPRNLDRRVEVLVPIEHPKHRDWLDQVLAFLLADDVVRWELQPDDTWARDGPARRLRAERPGAAVPLGGRAPGPTRELSPPVARRPFAEARDSPRDGVSFTVRSSSAAGSRHLRFLRCRAGAPR